MPTLRKRNESSVVTSVGKYLQVLENLGKILFWSRQQAGRIPIQNRNGTFRSIRLGREGVSDMWCMFEAKATDHDFSSMAWIECKLDHTVQTPDQVRFQEIANRCGHYYWVIRSCDDLEARFKEIGVL